MTQGGNNGLEMDAADWHARLDSDTMDWDAFGAWLDADPANRAAYDQIALLDAELADAAPSLRAHLPANDEPDVAGQAYGPQRRWWALGGIVAAALVGVIGVSWQRAAPQDQLIAYSTPPTETREIALRDGSSVRLDRGTSLTINGGQQRHVELASGAAFFDIKHDPARPFSIEVGSYEIRDLGTRFSVTRRGDDISVAVAQGRVQVAGSGSDPTTINAGRSVQISMATGRAELRHIAPADVASWRNGRLVYDNTPLPLVAADMSRYGGTKLIVDPAVADIRLSGVLVIGDGSHLVEQIQALLPISTHQDGDALRLGARAR
jgi:transmembrane sensor